MEFMYMISYQSQAGTVGYISDRIVPDENGEIQRDVVLRQATDRVERTYGQVAVLFFAIEPRVIRVQAPAA